MRQDTARQVVAKLLLHDGRKPGTIGPTCSLCEECLEVLADDRMQDAIFGRAGLVRGARGRHASAVPRLQGPGNAQKVIRRR